MNTLPPVLSKLLAIALGVALWVAAGFAAFVTASALMLGLALAGLWAMLTGRKAWWTRLAEARQQVKQAQGMWRAGQARETGAAAASAAQSHAAAQSAQGDAPAPASASDAPSSASRTTPLAQRRFGRAARLGVTDVQAH
jgi:hypothetical protein